MILWLVYHDGSSQTGTFTSNSKLTGDGGTLTFKVNDGTSDSNISLSH